MEILKQILGNTKKLFKWRHFPDELILLNLKWKLSYQLSYRNLEEMMLDRGIQVDHTTIYRWIQKFAPKINKKIRKHLRKTTDLYRIYETYLKMKGVPHYLYRAIDSKGQTIDFMLAKRRNSLAAKNFFKKILKASHAKKPRVINVDKNKAYPAAINLLQKDGIDTDFELRKCKYLNNIIEQDHRFIKKLVKAGMGFKSFITAENALACYESMHMVRKKQVTKLTKLIIRSIISE